jgi:hypothetical protein
LKQRQSTGISKIGVNSKKPPHYHTKFEKPPFFFEIAKIHRYFVGCLQCPLIVILSRVNSESDNVTRLSVIHGKVELGYTYFEVFLNFQGVLGAFCKFISQLCCFSLFPDKLTLPLPASSPTKQAAATARVPRADTAGAAELAGTEAAEVTPRACCRQSRARLCPCAVTCCGGAGRRSNPERQGGIGAAPGHRKLALITGFDGKGGRGLERRQGPRGSSAGGGEDDVREVDSWRGRSIPLSNMIRPMRW